MTETVIIILLWLGVMSPNTSYTQTEVQDFYNNNVCEVHTTYNNPTQFSAAQTDYYSNAYDVHTNTMIGCWSSGLTIKNLDSIPCP